MPSDTSLEPPVYRIRDARAAERGEIAEMWRDLMALHATVDSRFRIAPDAVNRYARHAGEMIRSRDARVLVAEVLASGELAGYLMGEIQARPPIAVAGTYGFISDMYIREPWRRHGMGRALFEEMRRWFVSRRAAAVELYVAQANPAASAFWEAMGMRAFMRLMHLEV